MEGRIQPDSGGFPAAPQGMFWRYCTVCMGILTLQKLVPDSDGFGRGWDSDGFLDPKYRSHQPSVEPMIPVFNALGTTRLKLMSYEVLSSFAFEFCFSSFAATARPG